jgi:hypothetical protein
MQTPAQPAAAAAARTGEMQRPVVVTLLAALKFIWGPASIVLGLVILLGASGNPIGVPFGVAFLGLGMLGLVCGVALWRLRPFGRHLQIALSIVGLFGFPLFTVISVLVLIYMFRPGVRVSFSGRQVQELTADEHEQLRVLHAQGTMLVVISVVLGIFWFIFMGGIMAAIAIPNFLNAVDRGKQKRTMIDMRAIGGAIESYASDKTFYPNVSSADELRAELVPEYIQSMPSADGWGHPFQVEASGADYTMYSRGKDGRGSECELGVTRRFNDEICFVNGQFVRYPVGSQE